MTGGSRFGHYEVVAPLGAGGMGEVFRARDSRLGREVALKVLPEAFASDKDRLTRFRREAQVLASLNHPHIAAIHGLEEADGKLALVLELVEGETLDARLKRAAIPIDEALPIARQIAEALEAAHEKGIIHRDLKPANVKVTPEGNVKLLDFGLAKAYEGDTAAADSGPAVSESPTVSRRMTEAGLILGTAAYMSPEQARGKAVDKRADIWSFGVVLYEMLTGTRLFAGETVSDTLAAVLTREPDWGALPSAAPPSVRELLRRCIQRDARERLRDIGEARVALTRILAGGDGDRAESGPSWRGMRFMAWAALAAAVVLGLALLSMWRPADPKRVSEPLLTLGIDAGGDTPLAGVGWIGLHWVGPTAVLSPDGRLLAFIARGPFGGLWQLYTRRLDELKAAPIAGTEGAFAPFFSPDSRSIGFFAAGRLLKVSLAGSEVTALCPAPDGRGGAWGENGTIVFAPSPDGPLLRVPSEGGTPAPATTLAPGERTHRWPQFLPGDRGLLYMTHETRVVSASGANIVIQPKGGGPKVVHRGGFYGRYVPSGHLLYVHEGRLFAAAFEVDTLAVTGRAIPILDDVASALINGGAQISFSDTGLFAYRRARSRNRSLAWMDHAGQFQPLRSVPAEYLELRFSPDGGRLVLVIADGTQSDIWVHDIARDTTSRLTFHPDNDWTPIWSPDGSRIAYSSWRPDVATFNLFLHRADGSGEPVRLTQSRNRQMAVEWHPSGRSLLFTEYRPDTGADLMLLPMGRGADGSWTAGTPMPLLASPADELEGKFSPDGKWLAYTSDESGRSEVYVRPFPGPGGRWQISSEGAEWVEWRRAGEIYYGRSEEVVMSVPYRVEGSTFRAGKPRVWMRIPPGVTWVDPHADGTRAAVIRSDDPRRESLVLLVNFFDHLRRTAGTAN